jgi:hypothetical protein
MITLHCCGEDYYADEMHIGGHIKYRKCGRFLTIESKTPLSSTSSGHPVANPSRTVVNPPRSANRRIVWGKRRLPLLTLALGGVLLGALVVWIAIGIFANHDGPSAKVPEAQMPVPAQAQPNAPLPLPSPEIPERVAISLPTGAWIIRPRGIAGHGVLKIENGSGLDAVVKLITADSPRRTVWMLYIRAHEQKSVPGIAVGNYLLRFALGLDWDADTRKFLRNLEFYQAGKQLEFTEIEPTSDEPGKYKEIEITLNEVFSGNLPREPINEIMFNEGDPPN